MKTRDENWNLYPVKYDGKLWNEDECNDIFISFYNTIYSLNVQGGIYIGESIWIYPDGNMEEF